MSHFEYAGDCPSYHPNMMCPAPSCKKSISQKQSALMCQFCFKMYHPPCKGVIGAAKLKKATESKWFCSPDCATAADSNPEPLYIPSTSNTFTTTPCSTGSKCEAAINSLVNRIDDQLNAIKSIISDVKRSQEFICIKFDEIKTEIGKLVAENVMLSKKCDFLEESYRTQDDRIRSLEFNIDGFKQHELNSDLILVGLPDKSSDPKVLIQNLFKVLQCEDSISDVIGSNYMLPSKNNKHKTSSPENSNINIIIKFKDVHSKKKVVLQKKKIKPSLIASDIGYQHNQEKQLYFRDNLTTFRYLLFQEARQIKKSKNFKYLWINDGNILFRESDGAKVIKIQSGVDLSRIADSK